jgi:hypothetical protein
MLPSGDYFQRQPDPERPETEIGTQQRLMDLARRETTRLSGE